MAADPWHFPRREFTARVLKLLGDGRRTFSDLVSDYSNAS